MAKAASVSPRSNSPKYLEVISDSSSCSAGENGEGGSAAVSVEKERARSSRRLAGADIMHKVSLRAVIARDKRGAAATVQRKRAEEDGGAKFALRRDSRPLNEPIELYCNLIDGISLMERPVGGERRRVVTKPGVAGLLSQRRPPRVNEVCVAHIFVSTQVNIVAREKGRGCTSQVSAITLPLVGTRPTTYGSQGVFHPDFRFYFDSTLLLRPNNEPAPAGTWSFLSFGRAFHMCQGGHVSWC